MNPNFVNKANYRFNTYHPTDIVKFDKATALELKFEYIINSIIYGLNEFDKAKASQHTDKEHSRSPRMIFQEQVIGKLGEYATCSYLKNVLCYSIKEPDITAYDHGKWDTSDLEVPISNGKVENWQIKTAKLWYAQFLLLEKNNYTTDGKYRYSYGKSVPFRFNIFIFQRIFYDHLIDNLGEYFFDSFKNPIWNRINSNKSFQSLSQTLTDKLSLQVSVKYEKFHFVTDRELQNAITYHHIMYKYDKYGKRNNFSASSDCNKTNNNHLQDDNYYIQIADMHLADELTNYRSN